LKIVHCLTPLVERPEIGQLTEVLDFLRMTSAFYLLGGEAAEFLEKSSGELSSSLLVSAISSILDFWVW